MKGLPTIVGLFADAPRDASPASTASSAIDPAEGTIAAEASSSSAMPQDASTAAAGKRKGIRATVGHMVSTVQLLQPGVAAVWKRVFVVDVLVTVQVLL